MLEIDNFLCYNKMEMKSEVSEHAVVTLMVDDQMLFECRPS